MTRRHQETPAEQLQHQAPEEPTAGGNLASLNGPAEQASDPPAKKKPLPTGARLFSLVWTRAAKQLRLLPSDTQRALALGFMIEELGLPVTIEPAKKTE